MASLTLRIFAPFSLKISSLRHSEPRISRKLFFELPLLWTLRSYTPTSDPILTTIPPQSLVSRPRTLALLRVGLSTPPVCSGSTSEFMSHWSPEHLRSCEYVFYNTCMTIFSPVTSDRIGLSPMSSANILGRSAGPSSRTTVDPAFYANATRGLGIVPTDCLSLFRSHSVLGIPFLSTSSSNCLSPASLTQFSLLLIVHQNRSSL